MDSRNSTTVYLLRHAAYENPKKIFHGRLPGFPLSREGREMAKQLAGRLAQQPIMAVYTSRLTRAYQTAMIVARPHRLGVTTDERLLDIRSPLQGKSIALIESLDSDFYSDALVKAGAERLEEVHARIDAFLREVARKHVGEQIVVTSHGDPIMAIATTYAGKRLPKSFPLKIGTYLWQRGS